jgi:hypothetical protein
MIDDRDLGKFTVCCRWLQGCPRSAAGLRQNRRCPR